MLFFTNLTSAGVTWTDDSVFGPGTIIRDLDNDKDFLQLDFTTTYNYYNIILEFGDEGVFEGWQVASQVDLEALATAAGIVDWSTDPAILSIAEQLMFWFCDACIRTSTTHKYARGLLVDTTTAGGWLAQLAFSIAVGFGPDGTYGTSDDYAIAWVSGYGPIYSDEGIWLIRDAPPNLPPIFDPIGSEIVYELNDLTIEVQATDPDGDILTYSAIGLPSGASFEASTQHSGYDFSWKPNGSQAGTYFVTFTVDDGTNPDVTEKVEITVLENDTGRVRIVKKKKALKKKTQELIRESETLMKSKLKISKIEMETPYDIAVTYDNLQPRNADTTITTYDRCGGDEGFQVAGECFDVSTVADFDSVEICLEFDAATVNRASLQFLHYDSGTETWADVTSYISPPNGDVTICATLTELSPLFLVTNNLPLVDQITGAPLEPQPVNTPVNISATFTDADEGDTHTAECSWGDSVVDTIYPATSPILASHAYATPGVYTIDLTVTDDIDGEGTSQYQYVVVYDSSAGFVTGGGWIDSQAGAYKPDPSLAGKANFGFVSKYKKGAATPTGNTEFQFHAGDLDFHSSSYEWLVITGSNYAMFKGEGTINGANDTNGNLYKFRIWAGDVGSDTLRIRIWEEDALENETDIYDNGFDQSIGGGSIVIHVK